MTSSAKKPRAAIHPPGQSAKLQKRDRITFRPLNISFAGGNGVPLSPNGAVPAVASGIFPQIRRIPGNRQRTVADD